MAATADGKLNALRDAIYDQIDDLHQDEEAGGKSPVTATGSDDGGDEGEAPPSPPPAPPAPKPSAPPAPEAAPAPVVAPPKPPEPKPAAEAPPTAAAPVASGPAAASQPDPLAGFDPQYANMLKKFAPGGKISTPADLARAQEAAANDYWRTQERMAEQARKAAEVPPPAPEEVPPPPELARYDTQIQTVVDRAKGIVANVTGWTAERARVIGEANALYARRQRGDSTVDPDEIAEKWAEVHRIDGHIQGWNREYLIQREKYDDLTTRRGEVELLLDHRARLDRQAQREADQERDYATQEFFATWSKTLKKIAEDKKVPPSRLKALEKSARHATYFAATEGEIEDVEGFLSAHVDEFLQPIEEARQAGATDYATSKATDAPRVPAASKPAEQPPPPGAELSPRDQLRALEAQVMNDKAWDEMGGNP